MFNTNLAITSPVLNVMYSACTKAARGLTRDFGEVEHLQVSRKGPGDFVTKADLKAEETIIRVLQKARPTYSMLVEESGEIEGIEPEYRWIVDPLDGTTNFINAIPHFAISIGLEYRGEIIAGMVYDPLKDECFYAEKGNGAYLNEQRIRVSSKNMFDDALIGVTFPRPSYAGDVNFYKTFQKIEATASAMRRMGSAVLDLCYVAAGRYEGYWSLELSPWDMAAGSIIVQEAGGYVTDLKGKNDFMKTRSILAGNEMAHGKISKLIS